MHTVIFWSGLCEKYLQFENNTTILLTIPQLNNSLAIFFMIENHKKINTLHK